MTSERVRQQKQVLDRLVRTTEFDDEEPSIDERVVYDEAIRNFLSRGPELLDEATPFLWEYYRSFVSVFSEADRSVHGTPEISTTSDIWDHVEFRHPPSLTLGGDRLEPAPSYVSFEGDVSWEPEHGLQLVFEHGERVCKVGPYDGHNTVAHATGDESHIGVVFRF